MGWRRNGDMAGMLRHIELVLTYLSINIDLPTSLLPSPCVVFSQPQIRLPERMHEAGDSVGLVQNVLDTKHGSALRNDSVKKTILVLEVKCSLAWEQKSVKITNATSKSVAG